MFLTTAQQQIVDSCPVSTLDASESDLSFLVAAGLIEKVVHERSLNPFYVKIEKFELDVWCFSKRIKKTVIDEEGNTLIKRWIV